MGRKGVREVLYGQGCGINELTEGVVFCVGSAQAWAHKHSVIGGGKVRREWLKAEGFWRGRNHGLRWCCHGWVTHVPVDSSTPMPTRLSLVNPSASQSKNKNKSKMHKICGTVGKRGREIGKHGRVIWPECIIYIYAMFNESVNKSCFKLPSIQV